MENSRNTEKITEKERRNETLPFTEKYRPRTLEEVTGNAEVLECLRSFTPNTLPNMLFYGPPGTGKTTTIRALLKEHPKKDVIELNASDERGIDTVRNIIKEFATVKSDNMRIVVLDEADSMSNDAQTALRRIMEDYRNTRFCIICNFSRKIIEPILSRCSKFRFCPVNELGRMREVCLKESIKFDEEGLALINKYSGGDMRKVMNDLQGLNSAYGEITKRTALEFFGICDENKIEEIYGALLTQEFSFCQKLISEGGKELISELVDLLVKSKLKNKFKICKILAEVEERVSNGCNEKIQNNAIIGAFVLNRD
ncbi:replication factor C subunit 3/5 [Enteropsectra breve]|nr:replication factor C subunit 3/5 [Enteropsectra breve]